MASFETEPTAAPSAEIETMPPVMDSYMPAADLEALIEDADFEVSPERAEILINPIEPMDYNLVTQSLKGLISVLGQIVTSRQDWQELQTKEVDALADASVNVMRQYPDFNPAGPKAMAWIGLGGAITALTMPRVQEKRARDAKDVSAND